MVRHDAQLTKEDLWKEDLWNPQVERGVCTKRGSPGPQESYSMTEITHAADASIWKNQAAIERARPGDIVILKFCLASVYA